MHKKPIFGLHCISHQLPGISALQCCSSSQTQKLTTRPALEKLHYSWLLILVALILHDSSSKVAQTRMPKTMLVGLLCTRQPTMDISILWSCYSNQGRLLTFETAATGRPRILHVQTGSWRLPDS